MFETDAEITRTANERATCDRFDDDDISAAGTKLLHENVPMTFDRQPDAVPRGVNVDTSDYILRMIRMEVQKPHFEECDGN